MNTELSDLLKRHGFHFTPTFDGRLLRDGPKWFIGRSLTLGDTVVLLAYYGDWRSDESHTWRSGGQLSPGEEAELATALWALKADQASAKEEGQEATSAECTTLWETECYDRGEPPYLPGKGLTGLYGCRIYNHPVHGLHLAVPCRDTSGKLWGFQRIAKDGQKFFSPGQRIKGCFHALGPAATFSARIYLCEGVATAASVYEAIRLNSTLPAHEQPLVVACFNAGNLEPVARALKELNPQAQFTVCADDDAWTTRTDGTPWNPGRSYAAAAASAVGGVVRVPVFLDLDGRPTDFNDLHVREGLAAVWACLEAEPPSELEEGEVDGGGDSALDTRPEYQHPVEQANPGPGVQAYWDFITPVPWPRNDKGKPTAPTHQKLVNVFLGIYGRNLIKQDRDLFLYVGTHWKFLEQHDHDVMKMQFQKLYSAHASGEELNSLFKLMAMACPSVPDGVDLLVAPAMEANFLNGTLVLRKDYLTQKYTSTFKPHEREDWVTNVLPYEYRPENKERNPEFEAMLDRVFEGDVDITDKKTAVAQMFGACLIPTFPHLFMLYGPPGTGKSTVMLIASRLVDKDNRCSVDPTQFKEFNMETMLGKLVNIDTDIEMNAPISGSVIRKIIDRVPIRVRRKNIKDVDSMLPSTHIFGGNAIPKTLDGATRAQDRRWTFLGFSKVVAKGSYNKEYHDWCFEQSPQGVLNFALQGLEDLMARGGHYLNPVSGKEKMEEWQLTTDPVGLFVKDCQEGEVNDGNTLVQVGPNWRIKPKQLWSVFVAWHVDVFRSEPGVRSGDLSRTKFYAMLQDKGFQRIELDGYQHFRGIGVREVANAVC